MGKSPAKWIKGVLFGKKSSKSNVLKKIGTEKESFIVAKAPSSGLAANPPSIANPEPCIIDRSDNTGIERENHADLSNEAAAYLPRKQDTLTKGAGVDNAEILRQERAAAMIQAAFRGYLARRAFWALKGIIRLQALIRGHLVRRQAIATLRCVQGIVTLQALVRGQRVRFSDVRLDLQKVCNLQNKLGFKLEDSIVPTQLEISKYAFARKLLASPSSGMPLSLQYDPTESNSAWYWLERWSSSRFWEHLMQPIGVLDFNSQKMLGDNQNVDTETIRPKRSFRRVSTGTTENNSAISASEYGKLKNNPKNFFALQTEALQENPQNELERVKRSLRKISASTTEANVRSELVIEKPKNEAIKVSSSPVPDVTEQPLIASPEKTSDSKVEAFEAQVSPKLLTREPVDTFNDEIAAIVPHSLQNGEKDENISLVTEEVLPMETDTSKENQSKTRRRRRSLSSKQEYPENGMQNTPTVPSYMAATASAKAKLRGQGSPRLSQDGAENGIIRRHSMPYSSNGKSNSQSPRVQKLAQGSGKGGVRSDKSLFSSKDYNDRAVMQEEWRR